MASSSSSLFLPDDDLPSSSEKSEYSDSHLCRKLKPEFGVSEMKIFLRLRPFTMEELSVSNPEQKQSCVAIINDTEVKIKLPKVNLKSFRGQKYADMKLPQHLFTFSHVYDSSCSQIQFYDSALQDSISSFLFGHNCLIFAYGATNSGKTFTIQGTSDHPGIIPQSLVKVFEKFGQLIHPSPVYKPISDCTVAELMESEINDEFAARNKCFGEKSFITDSMSSSERELDLVNTKKYILWISFLEVYNEQLFDLLGDSKVKLTLVHDRIGNTYVKGLKKIWVHNEQEAKELLLLGQKNLHVSSTAMNNKSSRSHCIFTVYVIHVSGNNFEHINSLSFCDLAGSERIIKTQNTGERLKEAGNINTSLMVLGRCIEVLKSNQANKNRNVVPFRESKLTRLFQAYFSGHGTAVMVVNVAPTPLMYDDTLNTLKFSALAKQVILIESFDKSNMNITNISAAERLTNLWIRSDRRLSSFVSANQTQTSKTSIATVSEDMEDEYELQELLNLIQENEHKLAKMEQEKNEIEDRVRKEVCEEFEKHINEMKNNHEEFLRRQKEISQRYLDNQTSMFEGIIQDLENQLKAYEEDEEDENSVSEIDQADANTSTAQFDISLRDKETKIVLLQSQLSKITSELENLKKNNVLQVCLLQDQIEAEKAKHKFEVDMKDKTMQKQIDQFKLTEFNLQEKLKQLEETHQFHLSDNEFLKLQLEDQETASKAQIYDLTLEIDRLRTSVQDLREEREQLLIKTEKLLTKEKSTMNDELLDKDSKIDALKKKLQQSRAELESLKNNVTSDSIKLNLDVTNLTKSNCDLIQEKTQLLKERTQLKVSLNEEKISLSKLGNILLEKDSRICFLEGQLKTTEMELEALRVSTSSQLKGLQDELRRERTEVNKLKQELENAEDFTNFRVPASGTVKRRTRKTKGKENAPNSGKKLRLSDTDDDDDEVLNKGLSPISVIQAAVSNSPTLNAFKNTLTNTVALMVNKFSGSNNEKNVSSKDELSSHSSEDGIAARTRRRLYRQDVTLECSPSKVVKVDSQRKPKRSGRK